MNFSKGFSARVIGIFGKSNRDFQQKDWETNFSTFVYALLLIVGVTTNLEKFVSHIYDKYIFKNSV